MTSRRRRRAATLRKQDGGSLTPQGWRMSDAGCRSQRSISDFCHPPSAIRIADSVTLASAPVHIRKWGQTPHLRLGKEIGVLLQFPSCTELDNASQVYVGEQITG